MMTQKNKLNHALGEARSARQDLADRLYRRLYANQRAPTCSRGCNHCCHYPVLVSILEGVAISQWLADRRLLTSSLLSRLHAASEKVVGLSVEVWLLSALPCVFLRDGTCMIYDARPAFCRMCYSVGDPDECHPHNLVVAKGVVPRRDILEQFCEIESRILRRLGQSYIAMPLPAAVLIGHKILAGASLGETATLFLKDFGDLL